MLRRMKLQLNEIRGERDQLDAQLKSYNTALKFNLVAQREAERQAETAIAGLTLVMDMRKEADR